MSDKIEIQRDIVLEGDIEVPAELEPARVELVGLNGGAGHVMAAVANGLKQAGNEKWMIDLFRSQCMDGDYSHLLRTAMAFCHNHGAREED